MEDSLAIVGIILGILGSIGGILWLLEKYKKLLKDRAFWNIYDIEKNSRIILVIPTGGKCFDTEIESAEEYQADPNLITTIEDSMAKASILSNLIDHGIQPEVKLHTQIDDLDKMEHLFLICGPVGNLLSRELLTRHDVPFPYKFVKNKTWEIQDAEGNPLHPEADFIKRDYAIMAKFSNPWSTSERPTNIYFAAGIEGLGTWAASYQLSTKCINITKYLTGQCDSRANSKFAAVISAERRHNFSPIVNITHMKAV